MNAELSDFLRSQWSTASPAQYGSKANPFVHETGTQRLSNGQRVPTGGMGTLAQAPPIGTTPEVPITAATLGVPAPDCGPKMTAVIDPSTGRWTCQPAAQGPSFVQLALVAGLGYLAWKWFQDQGKHKHHTTSEENYYDD